MRKTFPLLLLVAVAAHAAAQSGRRAASPSQTGTPAGAPTVTPSERTSAPRAANEEFKSLPESVLNRQIQSLDSGSFRLADFGGKVMVVNLWATWCGPCRMEIPDYERVRHDYVTRGVEFVGLTPEDPRTESEHVRQFARELKFGFRLGWADRETTLTLMNGRDVLPQTYVIAADGQVIRHWRGYAANGHSGAVLREAIDRALAAGSANATR